MPIELPSGSINAAIKYNPHLWEPDELRAIFVVRQTDLEDIVGAVRESSPQEVPQHLLICGHRGMGKSTLLRRVALAIEETPEIASHWLALNFPEEQYTVRTLTEFLLNVLDALADTLEQSGAPVGELTLLDAQISEISAMEPLKGETAALEFLDRWVKEHERGLVLLVDSSDMLLNSLTQGESKSSGGSGSASALWRLRKVLSHQPGLFWIGASYQALESQHQYQDAFHDFFALHELRPLDVAEMRNALIALARRFGVGRGLKGEAAEKEMARILDSRPERLKTLRLLSGGNPRTMVTLYELFAAGGDDSIQSDLKRLLDVMTPLYKARMEALSEQAQKLFAHLMESWNPIGVRELAAEAGIPSTTVSGQLNRLEVEGLVEKAALAGKAKRSGYQACERFFNVWYLMRYGTRRLRQRLTWAVQFMRLWFSRDELASIASLRANRHAYGEMNDTGSLEFSRAVAAALGDGDRHGLALEWSVLSAAHHESCRTRQAIRDLLPEALFDLEGSDSEFKDAADYLRRFSALDEILLGCKHVPEEERAELIQAVKGSIIPLEMKEGLAHLFAEVPGTPSKYEELRQILGREREELLRTEGGTEFIKAVQHGDFFPDCPSSKLAFSQIEACFSGNPTAYELALGFLEKTHQDEWLERAYQRAILLSPSSTDLWFGLGNLLDEPLKRYDEAEGAYRQALVLNEKNLGAWNNLGNLLRKHRKLYGEAEAAYRKALALDEKDPGLWHNLGNLLHYDLNRYEEAETAYRQAIALGRQDGSLWDSFGDLLQYQLSRYDEAESAYRQAIALDETNALPWNGLGDLLGGHLKRYDEAEEAYRKAIALDETYVQPWVGLGGELHHDLHRYDEAEVAYRRAIELDEKYFLPWFGLGCLLQYEFGRYEEAEVAYRQAIRLDDKIEFLWDHLGDLLQDHFGRFDEAEVAYRQAIALDPKSASSWNGLGNLLQDHLGRFDEAKAAYRQAIALDDQEACYVANLARLEAVRGCGDEATTYYRNTLELVEADDYQLQLQAHLWLGNRDSAMQGLNALAGQAAEGDGWAFFRLREQCRECFGIGQGLALAELMAASPWADFLLPFSLALGATASGAVPSGAAPDILSLAEEILEEIRGRIGR